MAFSSRKIQQISAAGLQVRLTASSPWAGQMIPEEEERASPVMRLFWARSRNLRLLAMAFFR